MTQIHDRVQFFSGTWRLGCLLAAALFVVGNPPTAESGEREALATQSTTASLTPSLITATDTAVFAVG